MNSVTRAIGAWIWLFVKSAFVAIGTLGVLVIVLGVGAALSMLGDTADSQTRTVYNGPQSRYRTERIWKR